MVLTLSEASADEQYPEHKNQISLSIVIKFSLTVNDMHAVMMPDKQSEIEQ